MSRTPSFGLSAVRRILTATLLASIASLPIAAGAFERGKVEIVGPDGEPKEQQQAAPTRYGPVANADTLWRIASVTRPDGSISVYQMMYALYLKNPHAFEQNNIHLLSRGSFLLIPTLAEARQYTNRQAVAQLRDDEQRLAASEAKKSSTNQQQAVAQTTVEPAAQPETPAPQQAESQPVVEAPPEPAQEVVAEKTVEQPPKAAVSDRERRLYDAQMRQLKEDLANSIGSIETLIAQNDQLASRVEDLSSTIVNLEAELTQEREAAEQAREQLAKQSEVTSTKVDNLLEQPIGASSIWLWSLSAGLAVVFGLIAWLILRHRKHAEGAQEQTVAEPMPETLLAQDAVAEQAVDTAEQEQSSEEDVLLDLGLDDNNDAPEEDALVDLALDDAPIEAISLDDDDEAAIDLDDDSADLLALDDELKEPANAEAPATESQPEMADIQELDLDLSDDGGELTQDALDALAAMDELAASDGPSSSDDDDSLEEAFDAIGAADSQDERTEESSDPDDIMDEFAAAVAAQTAAEEAGEPVNDIADIDDLVDEFDAQVAPAEQPQANDPESELVGEPDAEPVTTADVDELLASVEEASESNDIPQQVQDELDEPETEELVDIDSLLAESGPEQPLAEESGVESDIDIESLIAETQEAVDQSADTQLSESAPEPAELDVEEILAAETPAASPDIESEPEPQQVLDSDGADELLADFESDLLSEPDSQSQDDEVSFDELEQEFDLSNVADELLNETSPDQEVISEAEELTELGEDDSVDLDTELAAIEQQMPAEPESSKDGEDEYLDIDQLLAEADGAAGPDDDIMLVGDLEDDIELEEEDGIAAKLDLARAYIEIGDKEVAKQLLEEIASSGNDGQKDEATELLQRLS
ncbi:hypothetical protein GCM10011369_17180 [Neiella marina]|uniref:Pilus assembly protein FimV n=1 Tax=Neiella marina TaxID=508461 RepID=A0A8J2U4U0_9GAMM|nr:FimV/HubP family polar landmark protein [Neiella marina]GGA75885.1 hypothetical protein GCM10011369_17180 [Neiella marina]